jgi:hypothetical protein
MIFSTLMTGEHERLVATYEPYLERQVEGLVEDRASAPVKETESEPEPPTAPVA